MKRIELWKEIEKSEEYKLFGIESDGVELECWKEFITAGNLECDDKDRLLSDYLFFRTGFHYSNRTIARAIENAMGMTITGAAK